MWPARFMRRGVEQGKQEMRISSCSIVKASLVVAATLFFSVSPAGAALVYQTFSGTDCGGQGGFSNCTANLGGTQQGGSGSPAIYKLDKEGEEDFGIFPSITGNEFSLSFNEDTHVLSWSYTPGPGDPFVVFFAIKQGNEFALFHDDGGAAIFNFSENIDTLLGYNDFSHVTWFDSIGTAVAPVPIPGALPLFLSGLAGLAFIAKRRRRAA